MDMHDADDAGESDTVAEAHYQNHDDDGDDDDITNDLYEDSDNVPDSKTVTDMMKCAYFAIFCLQKATESLVRYRSDGLVIVIKPLLVIATVA